MQTIHIEFYGKLSDRMGTSLSCELPIQDMTIAGLRERLAKDHDYAELLKPAIRPVINDEMVQETAIISVGDRVAFLSPLSGG